MNPKLKKLITGIGTGVIGIVVAIVEYKVNVMPLFLDVILDAVIMIGSYFGIQFSLRNK